MTQTILIGGQTAIVGLEADGFFVARFEDGNFYRTDNETDATNVARARLNNLAGTAALADESIPENRRAERAAAFFRAAVINTPGRVIGGA